MNIVKTSRGFSITSFIDSYGEQCSIQKSSNMSDDFIWIGIDKPKPIILGRDGWTEIQLPNGALIIGRMHLNRGQVKMILPALMYFALHGELPK